MAGAIAVTSRRDHPAVDLTAAQDEFVTKADLQLAVAELRTEIRTIALSVVAILIAALVAAETLL